jgi:parallel beta-helix repeat protein
MQPLKGVSMKRALGGTVAVAVLAVTALFGLAIPASAAGRIVSPGQSIQAAIDAASPGDTIIVKPGTYHENLSITKDKITIIGNGATLEPPTTPGPGTTCDAVFAEEGGPIPPAGNGVCIAGTIDFETFEVTDYVSKVRILGLHVNGFLSGIFAFGAKNAVLSGNTANDNAEYGIFALSSKGTQIVANRTSGSDEAGIYVGGSHPATAKVVGNETSNNLLGVFIRDAEKVSVTGNRIHDNCAGIFVLADAPGPAGALNITGNIIKNNSKVCQAPEEEGGETISGLGIGLSGAHDVRIVGNIITGNNAPAGVEGAGVGVFTGDGGTIATGNVVKGNVIKNNTPDIFWDGAGTNTFTSNACATSVPEDLC